MQYVFVAIPDEDVPVGVDPTFGHLLSFYAGERPR